MAYGNTPQIETGFKIFSARNHCIGNHLFLSANAVIRKKPSGHPRDYAAIAKEGILRVATEYNSISFYVDDDTVSGFHYELIQAFAHDKGLKTEITPPDEFRRTAGRIKRGTLRRNCLRYISHQRTERLSAPHLSHHAQQASARATERKRRKRLTPYP